MTIDTRDFGAMEVDEKGLIHFVSPILGFEEDDECAILCDDELGDMFAWLQSVKNSQVCFIMVDPYVVDCKYAPKIPDAALKLLGAKSQNELMFKVLAVIPNDFKLSTVNLKSPIVINMDSQKAMQIVLEEDYSMRAPLIGEESLC